MVYLKCPSRLDGRSLPLYLAVRRGKSELPPPTSESCGGEVGSRQRRPREDLTKDYNPRFLSKAEERKCFGHKSNLRESATENTQPTRPHRKRWGGGNGEIVG